MGEDTNTREADKHHRPGGRLGDRGRSRHRDDYIRDIGSQDVPGGCLELDHGLVATRRIVGDARKRRSEAPREVAARHIAFKSVAGVVGDFREEDGPDLGDLGVCLDVASRKSGQGARHSIDGQRGGDERSVWPGRKPAIRADVRVSCVVKIEHVGRDERVSVRHWGNPAIGVGDQGHRPRVSHRYDVCICGAR
jgi:hypothetical protein